MKFSVLICPKNTENSPNKCKETSENLQSKAAFSRNHRDVPETVLYFILFETGFLRMSFFT